MADRIKDLDERLIWRGEYKSTQRYEPNDVVRHGTLLWRARLRIADDASGIHAPPGAYTLSDPNWDFHGTPLLTAAEIVALINGELGSTTWQGGGGVGSATDLSIEARDGDSLEVASSTGDDAEVPAATTSLAGLLTAADKTKLDSVEAGAEVNVDTDLSIGTHDNDELQILSSTGTDVTLLAATPTAGTNKAGLLTAADKTKLDGIEAGAEVNDPTDLAVANRTGTALDITSSTGNDATVPAANDTEAGLLTAANKVKLDGIEAGAEVNVDTDLSFGTHTDETLQVLSSTGTDITLPKATPVAGTNKAGLMTAADKTALDALVIDFNTLSDYVDEVVREQLTADRTYYIRPDGDDDNDGLSDTSGGAFLTAQRACDVLSNEIDPGKYNVTVKFADGTYAGWKMYHHWLGSGVLTFEGNTSTPGNVIIEDNGGTGCAEADYGAKFIVTGMRFADAAAIGCLAKYRSTITIGPSCEFGVCAIHMAGQYEGRIVQAASYTVVGNAVYNIQTIYQSSFEANGAYTVTFSGSITFSGGFFHGSSVSFAYFQGISFSGTFTGRPFALSQNAVLSIITGAGTGTGTYYFPGSSTPLFSSHSVFNIDGAVYNDFVGGSLVTLQRIFSITSPLALSSGALSIGAASGSAAGSMSSADYSKLAGIEAGAEVNVDTDLGIANRDADSLEVTSSTGDPAEIPAATTSLAGLLVAADKSKLDRLVVGPVTPQGRLVLDDSAGSRTNGVVGTSTAGATTIYYVAFRGALASFWDGTVWTTLSLSELSLALDSDSGHTGYHQSGKNFDLFLDYNGGSPRLVSGPAWTNDTTPSVDVRRQNGVWVNDGTMTARFGTSSGNTVSLSDGRATWVGTFRASADGVTDFDFGGLATGGDPALLLLWNAYNRQRIDVRIADDSTSWTSPNNTTRQVNSSDNMRCSFVTGKAEDTFSATYSTDVTGSVSLASVGVGIDSTTTLSGLTGFTGGTPLAVAVVLFGTNSGLFKGFHFFQALEFATGTGATFYGDANQPPRVQGGMICSLWM